MEWIKKILEKCTDEDGKLNLEKALEAINKDAPENVVPKHKYNELSESNKQLTDDVKTRDKQLDELKKSSGDVEETKKKIGELQEENKRVKKEKEDALRDIKFDAAIDKALADAKHPDLVRSKIDRAKLKLNDDGSVIGIDEQKKELTKNYPDQFEPTKKGKEPNNPEDNKGTTVTKEQFDKMGYLSKVKMKHDNQELYESLKGEGGNE